MDAILRALGYAPSFMYEKFRAEWSDDEGHVVLDHTPIGDIAEIEGKSRWIDRIARELGRERDRITLPSPTLNFSSTGNVKLVAEAENMTFRECGESAAKLEPPVGQRNQRRRNPRLWVRLRGIARDTPALARVPRKPKPAPEFRPCRA